MFDLTPAFVEGWAESQIGEGGTNAANNCVTTATQNCMTALGYPDLEPQTWTDIEYSPTFHGYTGLEQAAAFIAGHFANPPPVHVRGVPDVLAFVDSVGQRGEPCAVLFAARPDGTIDPAGSASHCCNPLRYDGQTVAVLNVATGREQLLSAAQFHAATLNRWLIHLVAAVRGQQGDDMTQADRDTIAALESSVHDLQVANAAQLRTNAILTWAIGFSSRIDGAGVDGAVAEQTAKGSDVYATETLTDPRVNQELALLRLVKRWAREQFPTVDLDHYG